MISTLSCWLRESRKHVPVVSKQKTRRLSSSNASFELRYASFEHMYASFEVFMYVNEDYVYVFAY